MAFIFHPPNRLKKALIPDGLSLVAYAEKKGFEIAGIYMDAGLSGRTLDRPGLQAIMQAIKDGDADTILVANRSRLFRGPLPEELRRLPVHALKERSLDLER